ncbi:hypothetical protein [Actinomycetospora chiangmaiensis]|uniref:hypothetical protein n=1 Tax=Actinomycetospora chiangmaiensis TaxID=402650 RepID=UPI0003A577BA|nr:hypothetical protein [Actinomycetospora chiangmaiensis]
MTLGVTTNPNGSRSAAYGGLTCGSVWSCPVCAAKIATRRADDLAAVMRTVNDLGGSAFLLTLTMRHTRGDRLELSRPERARRTSWKTAPGAATSPAKPATTSTKTPPPARTTNSPPSTVAGPASGVRAVADRLEAASPVLPRRHLG